MLRMNLLTHTIYRFHAIDGAIKIKFDVLDIFISWSTLPDE